jgi:hypothetical protein
VLQPAPHHALAVGPTTPRGWGVLAADGPVYCADVADEPHTGDGWPPQGESFKHDGTTSVIHRHPVFDHREFARLDMIAPHRIDAQSFSR